MPDDAGEELDELGRARVMALPRSESQTAAWRLGSRFCGWGALELGRLEEVRLEEAADVFGGALLVRGMIAVCGMGRPSGRRKSA